MIDKQNLGIFKGYPLKSLFFFWGVVEGAFLFVEKKEKSPLHEPYINLHLAIFAFFLIMRQMLMRVIRRKSF